LQCALFFLCFYKLITLRKHGVFNFGLLIFMAIERLTNHVVNIEFRTWFNHCLSLYAYLLHNYTFAFDFCFSLLRLIRPQVKSLWEYIFLDYGKLLLLLTVTSRVVRAIELFCRELFDNKEIEGISGNIFLTPSLFIFWILQIFTYVYQFGVPFVFLLFLVC